MLLLVAGASGVGKSTVRLMLEPKLRSEVECVELGHLLERHPVARTLGWRQRMAEVAVRRAIELQESGRHLLLSGDPVAAIEVVAAPSAVDLEGLAVCLLDISAAAQAERLQGRGDDPALLVHHQAFADWMRAQATDPTHMTHVVSDSGWEEMDWERLASLGEAWAMHTIDTTGLTRDEMADAVENWVGRALAGDAPILRVSGD